MLSESESTNSVIAGAAPSRRERRGLEIRERLARAALELFAKRGFAETTVEDITNAADVGKGTFFNYFPSKEHIFLAFAEMQIARLTEYVGAALNSNEPMVDLIRGLAVRMTAEPQKNPALIRMLLQANLASGEVQRVMLEKHRVASEVLAQLIALGQRRGEFRDDIPALELALALRHSMFGNVVLWSLAPETSLKERLDVVLEILLTGLVPRDGRVTSAKEQA